MTNSLSSLKPGIQVKGTVVDEFPFGVLLDIGIQDVEGFVHEFEIPSKGNRSQKTEISKGKTVTAWVLDANPRTRRVSLSLINPANILHMSDLQSGQQLEGVVSSSVEFGTFIDIGCEQDGLLHIGEIERASMMGISPNLEVGSNVTVFVDGVDIKKGRISLRLLPNRRLALNEIKPDSSYVGSITNIPPFGVFVDFGAQEDGLVHENEIKRATRQGKSPRIIEGGRVKVYVNNVNLSKKQVALRFLPTQRMKLHEIKTGVTYVGYITNVKKFGAFVDIDAVEDGLVHVSEISSEFVDDPATVVNVGQRVEVRVLSVSDGKISLSMK